MKQLSQILVTMPTIKPGDRVTGNKSCINCAHRSRLIKEDSSGYEVYCEKKNEVIADLENEAAFEAEAITCTFFIDEE
ncbi:MULTISPECIES: hypothetical protein [Leptolyngbya]|nr:MULTISPECIES: hypothetical protein [Leptolyngbya]MBD2370777.1 hypothetical protein [Leptolyngbya sp. FACHB-161]MBD2377070.1 hypothetical protein [Leptolyngbya sp. FACHB-238]MBD2401513.1 hypothetical protein [Leptolyngbya sp. FACHB-239]MBD2408065.1 hypothetical protein [Leptolyngbya sp. FACHB-402]ULP29613.1 hypothetical protein MCP04_26885 [Leptolyngbya boryana IU 594]